MRHTLVFTLGVVLIAMSAIALTSARQILPAAAPSAASVDARDDQLKAVQWYVQSFEQSDDAAALALMNAHFDRDTRMNALRQKWLGEFRKVVGTKLAVRVMQIDRRKSLAHQAYLTSNIPLAH